MDSQRFQKRGNISIMKTISTLFKVDPFCSPSSNGCFIKQMAKDYKCLEACFGLYADVTYINSTQSLNFENAKGFLDLQKEYNEYKKKFLENIKFDSSKENYGKFIF